MQKEQQRHLYDLQYSWTEKGSSRTSLQSNGCRHRMRLVLSYDAINSQGSVIRHRMRLRSKETGVGIAGRLLLRSELYNKFLFSVSELF